MENFQHSLATTSSLESEYLRKYEGTWNYTSVLVDMGKLDKKFNSLLKPYGRSGVPSQAHININFKVILHLFSTQSEKIYMVPNAFNHMNKKCSQPLIPRFFK